MVPPWVTETDCPATVRFSLLETVDEAFDVAVRLMVPLPVPNDGDTVNQDSGLEAVHVQFAPLAVMARLPDPPALPKGLPEVLASTVTLQGVAAWLMVNVWSPMVSEPDRPTVEEFAATE